MKKIRTKLSNRTYGIYVRKDIDKIFKKLIQKHFSDAEKLVLVTNNTIYSLYGEKIRGLLKDSGLDTLLITIEDGEKYKTLDTVKYFYKKFKEFNIHRNDLIVPFSGGVIGDTAGFAAATFHRGVRLIQYPTTIIGQIDSSIGGKVGINYDKLKNFIGSFYQPFMTLVDTNLLSTLKEIEIINGFGEIIKNGIVFDKKILDLIDKRVPSEGENRLFDFIKTKTFEDIIFMSCNIKAKVVEKDEFDQYYRHLENFGHTVGHAIERASNLTKINHGQGVSLGMLVALDISRELGLIEKDLKDYILKFYKKLKLPCKIKGLEPEEIMKSLMYDKKFTASKNKFVLLKGINKPTFYFNVKKGIIEKCIINNME